MAFKGTTIPDLPTGFVDQSDKNDVCTHFEKEWNGFILEIWIAQDDPKMREVPTQYTVSVRKPGETEMEDFTDISVEDFSEEGLRVASARIKKELYKLMKKYY